jgi:iron complex outermembrane recepter protein
MALEEVTVTATRHAEVESKVPISITAFTQEQMDAQGLREVNDLVRYTPGLNLNRGGNGQNDIAIRGISSSAGAGTTGIYIDDTPIQVRNIGYNAGTSFPALFDLDRVEVLRGPQGTLFGADSEGGTVRFIQTTPNLSKLTTYDRFEVANTQGGALSYEGGAAVGGPIIQDQLGFRVSAFFRRDGGYIDGVNGTFATTSPRGTAYGDSVNFTNSGTTRPNTNWSDVAGFHGSLKWAYGDFLTVTPSITYQRQHINDGFGNYWLAASDPGSSTYARPVYNAGDPATNPALNAVSAPNRDLGVDRFYMPALLVNVTLGPVDLVSNTSYFDRSAYQWYDATNFYQFLYSVPPNQPGYKAAALYQDAQSNLVQEVRLQSNDPRARFTWVAGLFFSRNDQMAFEETEQNFLENAPVVGLIGDPLPGVTNGNPFGPGTSAFVNYFGTAALPGGVAWNSLFRTIDKQKAFFAQADLKLTSQLKVTAGLRVSRSSLELNANYGGPENNLIYPSHVNPGQPCIPGACTPGQGPYALSYTSSAASTASTETTPKISVSYQLDDANLFYATAAKGFRPAGASLLVPVSQCGQDLHNIGYLTADGKSTQQSVYGADSVWSYEVGAKNRLFDGRATLDASIYQIRWSNIQTNVFLPICAYSFDTNLGHATAQGFDLGLRGQPIEHLTLAATIGYNKTTFDGNSLTPNGRALYPKGSGVPGVGAPWTASFSPQYNFNLSAREFYIRADYTYSDVYRRAGQTEPGSSAYNPLYLPIPTYSVVNMRLGTYILGSGGDLSVFVNNLNNAHPQLSLAQGGFAGGYPAVWTDSTLRPRTYGLTLTYRY